MKPLLLFAIVAAVTGNLTESPKQRPAPHEQQVTQTTSDKSGSVTATVENAQRSESTSNSKPKSPTWYTTPEWVLVGVGIVTCVVIGWQSWETRGSVTATANAQRSWIVTEGVDKPDLQQVWINRVIYRFRVIGNSPVRPLEAKIKYELVKSRPNGQSREPDLPEQPNYGEPDSLKSNPSMGRIQAPNDPIIVTGQLESLFIRPEDAKAIEEGGKFLCAYGFVRYRDAFSEKKRRETRFCLVCGNRGPLSQRLDDGFVVGGPPSYNDVLEVRCYPAWKRLWDKAMSVYRKTQHKTEK
jgi:hypothetical protein